MQQLRVEAVENGFVVFDGNARDHGFISKTWVFETATSLSEFMRGWGAEQERTKLKDTEK